jgi:hypothetical protein
MGDRVYPLLLTIETVLPGRFAQPMVWDNLTISALTNRRRESLTRIFAATADIPNRLQALETPVVLTLNQALGAAALVESLLNSADWTDTLNANLLSQSQTYMLAGGQ